MTNDEIQQRIDEAAQIATKLVMRWPAWKQNILVQNLKPMANESRKPISIEQDSQENEENIQTSIL